jgi:HEAT repeat protein
MNTDDNDMNCQHVTVKLTDWLTNELTATDRATFDAHVAECADCQQEVADTQQIWQRLANVPTPEPHPEMRTQFYAMLGSFEQKEVAKPQPVWKQVLAPFRHRWAISLAAQVAYSVVLLGIGLAAGLWLQRPQKQDIVYQEQIDTLSVQVQEMRQMMMLSLLENPSATERLRAVGFTKDIPDADSHVIDALLMTLNNDPNVNVRLVTLEALADLAHDARVREGLVQSLTRQESPMVQVALADVMVKLQEKRSLKPLRQLLQQPGTNNLVKSKLVQTIKDLS